MTLAALRNLIDPEPIGAADKAELIVDDVTLPVAFKHNAKARRIILRMNPKAEGVLLTVPPGTTKREALAFARSQTAWIAARMKRAPKTVAFTDGMVLPVRGVLHQVRHMQMPRRTVWCEAAEGPEDVPTVYVSGRLEHLPRRLKDWFKAQARLDLAEASTRYAAEMGLKYTRLTVRDQSSRWGSCSSSGALSYSWRLILAPEEVLDYVAAHEVAHLAEMNHSPRFWSLVERHCAHMKTSQNWLKQHGRDLHRYGA